MNLTSDPSNQCDNHIFNWIIILHIKLQFLLSSFNYLLFTSNVSSVRVKEAFVSVFKVCFVNMWNGVLLKLNS